jgi:protein-S-isoprenylcysteine O-methyltransferase Ste14
MPEQSKPKINKYGKLYIFSMITLPVYQLALFIFFAHRTDYLPLWLFFIANLLAVPLGTIIAAIMNPDIINYRGMRKKPGLKLWDKILIRVYGLFAFYLTVIMAAYNISKDQNTTLPLAVSIMAIPILFIGRALFVWGMCVNDFFDTMVHIQDDRSHKVITTGPYQYVRHPGYTGIILWIMSIPLILGSAIALIPAAIACAILVLRTYLEDKMLKQELQGYPAYAERVRYRLCIGIW